MGKKFELTKSQIIGSFPKLELDPIFEITSPSTPVYNCIAWAYLYDDRWMWPAKSAVLDGLCYWPDGVEYSEDISHFIKAFEDQGYEKCEKWEHEDEYRKVALYHMPASSDCTHAARERYNKNLKVHVWTSKLGKHNDIEHCDPYSIEGNSYGQVGCILKKHIGHCSGKIKKQQKKKVLKQKG